MHIYKYIHVYIQLYIRPGNFVRIGLSGGKCPTLKYIEHKKPKLKNIKKF